MATVGRPELAEVFAARASDETSMKTIPQSKLCSVVRFRGTFLVVLAICLAAGLTLSHAAQPSVKPLLQGKLLRTFF